jgi:hypothetical protein
MKILLSASLALLLSSPAIAQVRLTPSSSVIRQAQTALARVNHNNQTKIKKVAVADGWALVKWTNGEIGGLATFKKKGDLYEMVSDSSRGWPGVAKFSKINAIPIPVAKKLLNIVMPDWPRWENGSK